MGFTLYSTIIYLFLFIADLFAFVKGKENKKMIPFIVITTIIIISKGKVILIFDIYSFMIGKYLIIVPIITGMYNKLQTKYNGIVFLMYSFI